MQNKICCKKYLIHSLILMAVEICFLVTLVTSPYAKLQLRTSDADGIVVAWLA